MRINLITNFSFYSSINKFIWGIVFLQPIDTFTSSKSYEAMSTIATEFQWGIFLCASGILQFLSVFSNNIYFRVFMQVVSIAIWLFIATMLGISNPTGTGVWIYSTQAIIDFFVIIDIIKRGGFKW